VSVFFLALIFQPQDTEYHWQIGSVRLRFMLHICYMIEEYLHYIWKFQHFNCADLETTRGEKIEVLYRGDYNHHAGPDFLEAKINIAGVNWFGHIEIHLKSSDWFAHKHENDEAYKGVVLHVVWEHNREVVMNEGEVLPVLELKSRCDEKHWQQYQRQLPHAEEIPCAKLIKTVEPMIIQHNITRMFVNRIEQRAADILERLELNQGDWNTTAWTTLCAAFGFGLNKLAFIHLAERVPWKLIERYRDDQLKIIALLFGQAGWLEERPPNDPLKRVYMMLKSAYGLVAMEKVQWNFGQVHPANFPTQRLFQLCKALHLRGFKMAYLLNELNMDDAIFQLQGGEKWTEEIDKLLHGIKGVNPKLKMGKTSANTILVNAHLPLIFAYAVHHQIDELKTLIIDRFHNIPPEENKTLRLWKESGVPVRNMLESQGLIELYKSKCTHKKCLSCSIGNQILKTT